MSASPSFVLGYGTNGFADHPLDSALDVLQANGYRAVALTLGHPHLDPFTDGWQERTDRLAADLAARELRVVVETGARYLLDPFTKHRPTLVDEDADARMAFLARAIRIAARLGADCVSLWSGVLPRGADAEHGRRLLVERMALVVADAAEQGVTIGFEPEPGMLIETVDDALALREALGNPETLGITVDLGHCVAVEPGGVEVALRKAGSLLVNVQVDDMLPGVHEHLELGTGRLDLDLALRTLIDIDYRGVAAVELPRHSHDAPRLARTSMAALTDSFARIGRPAEHPWVTEARRTVGEHPGRIGVLFAGAGRGVGREPVDPVGDPAGLVQGFVEDGARSVLVQTLATVVTDEDLGPILRTLYQQGDDAERRGVLRGLAVLDAGPAVIAVGQELTKDALRANDPRVVAAAMGPFAAAHLDQHAWRHGVLKLLFMQIPLDAAAGLTDRQDAELARMADGFAAERRAAGREVSADVDRISSATTDRAPADTDPKDA